MKYSNVYPKDYTILFCTEARNIDEITGSVEIVNRADIVVGYSGMLLKDRYGNATSVLVDLYRRMTA